MAESGEALDFVSRRIMERYSNPARRAYLYLFRLKPDSDFAPIVPIGDAILTAWIDEGNGLALMPTDESIERARAALDLRSNLHRLPQRTMRQTMARVVVFSVVQSAAALIAVHLLSRALMFSPKGDREVHEQWRPIDNSEGKIWYSAYQPLPE